MPRECLECKAKVIGRTDKKFCSLHCKSSYHNKLHADVNNFVRRTNGILKRNRKTLKKFLDTGICRVHRQELIAEGFSFKHFTSQSENKNLLLKHCYEYAYANNGPDFYDLFQFASPKRNQLKEIAIAVKTGVKSSKIG